MTTRYVSSAPTPHALHRFFYSVETIQLAGLCLFIASFILSESIFQDSLTIPVLVLRLFAYYLMLLGALTSKMPPTTSDFFGLLAIVIVFVSAVVSQSTNLLQVFVAIYLMRNACPSSVFKVAFWTVIIGLLSVAAFSLCGIIDEHVVLVGARERSSLGFAWPSRPQNYVLTAILLYMAFTGRDGKRAHYVLFLLLALFVFGFCDSRAPFILSCIAVLLGFVLASELPLVGANGILRFFVKHAFLIGLVFTFAIALLYSSGSAGWDAINSLVSNRLQYSHSAVTTYPLALFGSPVFGNQNDAWFSSYLDSGYLNLIYVYGLLPAFIFFWGLTAIMQQALERGDRALVYALLICAVHAVVEAQIMLIQYTPFLFAMFGAFRGNSRKRVESQLPRRRRNEAVTVVH